MKKLISSLTSRLQLALLRSMGRLILRIAAPGLRPAPAAARPGRQVIEGEYRRLPDNHR